MAEHDLTAIFEADIRGFTSSMDALRNTLQDVDSSISDSMDGASNSTSNATGSISSTLKGLGGIIAGAFALDKIKDFGVSIVQEAASMSALNSQFEQVFGGLQGEATKAIDGLAKEFGMVSSRITPSLTQMTSMFKGLGMDTEQAMDTASRAVTVTADAAAFYDKSFEDANSALNSFIKGNYEGGEAIGLFGNATQMATYASEELGQDWDKLDEAGKQLVRLQFAESMQESAGAMGQAQRESTGLENVMGNLTASWDKFKGILGTAFLPMAIAGIQKLGGFISGINVEAIANGFTAFGSWFGSVFSPIIGAIKANFTEMFGSIDATSLSSSFETVKTTIMGLGDTIAIMAQGIGAFIDEFDFLILGVAAGALAFGVMKGAVATWAAVTKAAAAVQLAFNGVMAMNPIGIVAIAIGVLVAAIVLLWKNWDSVSAFLATSWELIKATGEAVFNGLASFFTSIFASIGSGITAVWDGITSYFSTVWNGIVAVGKLVFDGLKLYFTTVFNIYKTIITTVWNAIKTVLTTVFNGIKTVATTVFNAIKTFLTTVMGNIKTNITNVWDGIKSTLTTVFNAIKTVATTVWNAIKTLLTNVMNNIKTNITNVWNSIKSFITSTFNAIKGTATSVWEGIKTTITNVTNGIKTTITGVWDTIKSTTTTVWNGIKTAITSPIETAKKTVLGIIDTIVNAFSKMKITIPKPKMPKVDVGSKTMFGGAGGIPAISVPTFDLSWHKSGAIVKGSKGGTVVGVGENNGDEAIVPLSNKSKMLPFAQAVAGMIKDTNGGGNSSSNEQPIMINFNVENMTGSKKEADDFSNRIASKMKRLKGGF